MRNEVDKIKQFSRRVFFIFILQIVTFFILIIRLLYLQIIKFKTYVTLSDSNRIRSFILLPARGNITDYNGKIIASNKINYRILLNTIEATDIDNTLTKLASLISINKKDLFYYSKRLSRKNADGFVVLYDKLNWEKLSIVETNMPFLPGILTEDKLVRYYPNGNYFSHIIGYVSTVNKAEIKKSKSQLLKNPDFRIGKSGIEKVFEQKLRGKAGVKYLEVDALGFSIRELNISDSKDSVVGENVQLSLNKELQIYITDLMQDKQGSVSVIDVTTGEILALVSLPNYDPNLFVKGISSKEWNILINNSEKPLRNKAISNYYPPGSTFKIIVALAALKKNISYQYKKKCTGNFTLGNRKFHCWKEKGHGNLNMVEAIAESCNVYFYQLGKMLNIEDIYEMALELGLGQYTKIDLPNEKKGIVPSRKWKNKIFKTPWVKGDNINTSIGQGFLQVTNVQLLKMIASIATNGKNIIPTIIKQQQRPIFEDLNINKEHIDIVRQGLYNVVNTPRGSAFYRSVINIKEFPMSGKTGTSQVIARSEIQEKDEEKILYYHRNHSLFVGFAPFIQPRYAISTIIDHAGSGSKFAAPISSKILKYIYKNMYKKI